MIITIAFVLGCVTAWAYGSTKRRLDQQEHDKQMTFVVEEVARLRRQVADTIGRGPYG